LSLPDLSSYRILVSNDDGIAARGLKLLERIAKTLSKDVWVVAPELEQSGAGHSLTLRRPLRIRQLSRRHFAVDGTPTDAVLLGINQILKQKRPDLVLSGINRGGNMGEDVTYSGTIAAAMEATLLGVPAIALSLHYTTGGKEHWETPEAMAPEIIRKLVAAGWPKNVMINVNFPDRAPDEVQGFSIARQGRRKLGDQLGERVDMRGEHYYWIGPLREESATREGTDIWAVNQGCVSITPLDLDLTHDPTSKALAGVFR
jgi:5'-nucleotidase